MKWGRRKKNLTSPSSSPSSSIISRVLPISWFSKLRRNFETAPAKSRHEAQFDFFPTPCPNLKRERFYSMDVDDPFWRLSFSEEKIPARRSTGGIMGPVWHDFDCDLRFPVSRLEGETVCWKREECRNFNDMVRHVKRRKEREKIRQRMKDGVFVCDHQSSRKFRKAKRSGSGKDVFPAEPPEYVPAEVSSSAVSKSRKQSKNQILPLDQGSAETSEGISSASEWQLLNKNGSFSLGMRVGPKQKGKAKACSPRTECKIRSLEEMKRARTRTKTKMEEGTMEGKTVFNSFAVVKNSLYPQRDFRNSMVEMIREKGIFRQEDLEELLASYLALNSDECHGIIIEVFQKVWFELRGARCFDY